MLARRMADGVDAASGQKQPRRGWTVLAGGGTASDETLLEDFLRGESHAFGELVRRHQRLVQALVRRYAARPEDAADLAQATFLRAFAAARRSLADAGTRQPGLFKAWLVRIAVNVGKNHARDAGRWRMQDAEVLTEWPPPGPTPRTSSSGPNSVAACARRWRASAPDSARW